MIVRGRELPLWIWAAGYLEFLWQTLVPGTLPLGMLAAPVALALAALCTFSRRTAWATELRAVRSAIRGGGKLRAALYLGCFVLLAGIFLLSLWNAMRPPFLPQEYDAINYQMGVPRQLLLLGSLRWIGWSVPDLWPMAMQWGMAPLSFAFGSINKFPQWLFAVGAAACLVRIPRQLDPSLDELSKLNPLFAVLGTHGVVTQLGTGMMDLPALYLLLLSLSALLDRRFFVAALALSIYVASKAFHPIQISVVVVAGIGWFACSRRDLASALTKFLSALCICSLLLLARPAIVSLEATGTPLFPFAPCRFAIGAYCSEPKRAILDESAAQLLATRENYGNGRGPAAFLSHLWRVAVPTNGVNNEFDYPIGLSWLLFLVLAAFSFRSGAWRNPTLGLAALFWAMWWMNAHQSRWLYPTLAFGFLGTIPAQRRAGVVLPACLLAGLAFSGLSHFRSLRPTFMLGASEIRKREAGKVEWHSDGRLMTTELLYVDRPAPDHTAGGRLWILR